MVGEVPWNANGEDRIGHKTGKADAEAKRHPLDRQMTQIARQSVLEVAKGSEAEARLYSALHDYPVDHIY